MNRIFLFFIFAAVSFSVRLHAAQSGGPIEITYSRVPNPPPVQMIVPGFTVRELPLEVSNINNLVYAPDGRLFALCYDGDVLQLKDSDGDGLEDTITCFFKNENNAVPPSIGMAWGPGGLYIASQKRVIRLRDKGNGTGELETITSGWVPPTGAAGSSLDSIGMAVDSKSNIFFGLGCDNWMGAYRVSKETGRSDYNIYSERGTILKVSPDWKHREIVATGVRFTVSLAFNEAGDLFCTDQEGATWLPNGNPLDELLHIQQGRHYGFPPRHPKYLPGVIDEPSVFDYAPQHESTCGLHFNLPVANGTNVFGPNWWRGDAIIAGESRGKIFRTKLVKTAAGYVAQNSIIACLTMLTIDAAPTPQGDLLVTCHSGKPDWGTGPQGKGKLFKISYTDKDAPQPVLAFAAGPTETRIVFDRPFDPAQMKNLLSQCKVTMGRYVTAGDRYESFEPGYQAVQDQLAVPRYNLPVLSAAVSPDARMIVLQTAPRTAALNYAVTVPRCGTSKSASGEAEAVDVLTDLTGVEATWHNEAGETKWSGWLPHLDLTAARGLTAASAEHQQLFELLTKRGTLTLRGQFDLGLMLRTAVQPGAKIDFEYPTETVTVVLKSAAKLDLKTTARVKRVSDGEVQATTESRLGTWLPFEVTLQTGSGEPTLDASWLTVEDERPRAFPVRRVLMPWAVLKAEPSTGPRQVPEIAGGDWENGRKMFFDKALCYKCHTVRGTGGKIGPDLSNLVYRDYASVLRDITEPSAAINPDFLAFNVQLNDGEMANGVVMENTAENLVLGQVDGRSLTIPKSKVKAMKPSTISLMPENILQGLSEQQRKDLLTFLLMEPPTEATK
jgi:putative heme-binding domain-containing protein